MLKTLIVGASGYSGIELVFYLNRHKNVNITSLAVSKNSKDIGKCISDVAPQLKGIINIRLQSITDIIVNNEDFDVVFFATDHFVSYDLVPLFISRGCVVFDLSGSFRMKNSNIYTEYYGFVHHHLDLLEKSVYGLPEWNAKKIKHAQLLAIPGCYPTCIQLGLKPLVIKKLLCSEHIPVVNAISGVSGAGKKSNFNNNFCEVSLHPYNIFIHRHSPEIMEHLKIPIIFIPHIGAFSRGILATITCRLKTNISYLNIIKIFDEVYQSKPCIRLYNNVIPKLKSVIRSPFCDIGFALNNQYLVIVVTEDNLLKGAATQAIQCFNIRFGFFETESLI
ncbi:N-acetyl-gamma-glutamyl-phosphate reductase [Buchnera aphidicola (Eriosoma grossulariae)]|uniref:N-acetyl-gamma-glutamyl-phosphate reductase n=1 Tax=Buchnera aphidicola TaxID=9 RepID=UPI0034638CB3